MGLISGLVKYSLLKRVFNAFMRRRDPAYRTAPRGRRVNRRSRRAI